ncbi:MAG: hypothetical protein K2X77_14340 [Candidatus Obscuribacterales bacterium]|jgi:archaellum component FlaG (FlaF/FlaG flagellin family)|nr:hypothetical protein [Candidatus Obscuribacterales bacterium]
MAEIDDKPKAKAETTGEESDNSHLREDKKEESSAKPEDKAPSEKKDEAPKPESPADKGDKTAASTNLLQDLSPKDYQQSLEAFKKTPLQAETGLKGLDLFSKEAPKFSFEQQKSAESLLDKAAPPLDGQNSEAFSFAKTWSSLSKTFDVAGFLKNEGPEKNYALSERSGLRGKFCSPFDNAPAFKFDNGMAVVGFQPALAGAEGRSAMKDFGLDTKSSESSSWNWDTVLDVFESGKNAVNTMRAKLSNTLGIDLSFGLGDHNVDKTVEQLKLSGDAKAQSESFNRFAEKSATENAQKFLGSAEIKYDSFKVQDSTVQVTANGDKVTHTIKGAGGEQAVIEQGRVDENGKRDASITVSDTTLKQDKNGGREITNEHSDIKLKQNPDGSVEAYDKSGKKLFDFKNTGDANLYFNNAVAEVVKPGESIEAAYARLQKDNGDAIKGKPVIVIDGKGESLIVQPDGTRVRNHANGNAEMIFKAKDAQGKEHDVYVRVRKGEHGQYIKVSKTADGEQFDVNDKRILPWLKGSKLSVLNGELMIDHRPKMPTAPADEVKPPADTTKGDKKPGATIADANNTTADQPAATQPAATQPAENAPDPRFLKKLFHQGIINLSADTKIDTNSGTITQREGNQETVITPNKETGVAVAQTFKLKEDGTRESDKPLRTMTFDHGKTTVQGEHPRDTFTFNSDTKELHAFNNVRTRPGEDAEITDDRGNHYTLDDNGDFHAFDRHGNEIASSDGDHYSYDNGRASAEYHERLVEQQTAANRDAVSNASAIMSEVASLLGRADIPQGAIAGMRGNLAAIRAKCGALGIPVPGEVSAAESCVDALQMKALVDHQVGQTLKLVNLNTTTLRDLASNVSGSPEDRARTVLKQLGIALPCDKR